MEPLDIKEYRPPFVTETDELRWDDCTVCATLMAVATATLGETVSRQDWTPLSKAQLKTLRERIRNHLGPSKQSGPTTMADMRKAFKIEYPWLPYEIPFYDEQNNTWPEVVDDLLQKRRVALLQGNPSEIKNVNSPLRRWTHNDDFGHAIYADHARRKDGKVQIFIMDPLGRGEYEGQYVDADEVRQYMWEYGSYVKANMFPRGGWSRTARRVDDLNVKIKELSEDLAAAKKAKAVAEAQRLAADAQRAAAIKERDEALHSVDNLEADILLLESSISALEEKVASLESTVESLNAQTLALAAERDGALSRAVIEQTAKEEALKKIQEQAKRIDKRNREIKELKEQLAKCKPL